MIASTAPSSCSIKLTLGIHTTRLITQLGPQVLQSAELKLLDCALTAPNLMRDFANALLLGEAHPDDTALIYRKPIDKLEEPRSLFDFVFDLFRVDLRRQIENRGDFSLFRRAFRAIDNRI